MFKMIIRETARAWKEGIMDMERSVYAAVGSFPQSVSSHSIHMQTKAYMDECHWVVNCFHINSRNCIALKGMYAVWICYGWKLLARLYWDPRNLDYNYRRLVCKARSCWKLKLTLKRMCNTPNSIYLWCIHGLIDLDHHECSHWQQSKTWK